MPSVVYFNKLFVIVSESNKYLIINNSFDLQLRFVDSSILYMLLKIHWVKRNGMNEYYFSVLLL